MSGIHSFFFIRNAIHEAISSFTEGNVFLRQVNKLIQLIGFIGIVLIIGKESAEKRRLEPGRVEHINIASFQNEHEVNAILRGRINQPNPITVAHPSTPPLETEDLPIETIAELVIDDIPLVTVSLSNIEPIDSIPLPSAIAAPIN